MSDAKATHVKIWYSAKTKTYLVEISAADGKYLLDIGPDKNNVNKVVKMLKEEYGGIQINSTWN